MLLEQINLYFKLFANIQNDDHMFNVFAFWERMSLDQINISLSCEPFTAPVAFLEW